MTKAGNLERFRDAGARIPRFIVVDSPDPKAVYSFVSQLGENARFAVRSSNAQEDGSDDSFAGVFDTFLNVSAEDANNAVIRCFNSFSSERSQAYRRAKNLPEHPGGRVIIQQMIDADVSGVAFSMHPNFTESVFLIEAVWGLGEGLVSGACEGDQICVTPAGELRAYRVAHQSVKRTCGRTSGSLVETDIPILEQSTRKLDSTSRRQVLDLIILARNYLQTEVDIEWCMKDGVSYLLQARPLTFTA